MDDNTDGRMKCFGKDSFSDYLEHLPVPVGALCSRCAEAIGEGDSGVFMWHGGQGYKPLHRECMARMVLGSVAHIEGRCSCKVPGAAEGDDPKLTKREAAKAALEAFTKPSFKKRGAP